MKTMIVYDSTYGNTGIVARTLAKSIARHDRVKLVRVRDADYDMLRGVDMLIVGSPTQGGRPTARIQEFLDGLPELHGMDVAAFDTRFSTRGHGPMLALVMKIVGYAAEKIDEALTEKGGTRVLPPRGFVVTGKRGPIRSGDLVAAVRWLNRPHSSPRRGQVRQAHQPA
jgi:flavodoxin